MKSFCLNLCVRQGKAKFICIAPFMHKTNQSALREYLKENTFTIYISILKEKKKKVKKILTAAICLTKTNSFQPGFKHVCV